MLGETRQTLRNTEPTTGRRTVNSHLCHALARPVPDSHVIDSAQVWRIRRRATAQRGRSQSTSTNVQSNASDLPSRAAAGCGSNDSRRGFRMRILVRSGMAPASMASGSRRRPPRGTSSEARFIERGDACHFLRKPTPVEALAARRASLRNGTPHGAPSSVSRPDQIDLVLPAGGGMPFVSCRPVARRCFRTGADISQSAPGRNDCLSRPLHRIVDFRIRSGAVLRRNRQAGGHAPWLPVRVCVSTPQRLV